jgi:hypothetical protein
MPQLATHLHARRSADGLCTASPLPDSLRTRYCGFPSDARTARPAASVSEVIFRNTVPVALPPREDQVTLSPFRNDFAMQAYRVDEQKAAP